MPPPIVLKPSPGLRIVLLVALAMSGLATGLVSAAGLAAVAGGEHTTEDFVLLAVVLVLFAMSAAAFVGVAMRAPWSRWVAIAAGIMVSLTCCGSVFGIPILVTAARAPDLTKQRA